MLSTSKKPKRRWGDNDRHFGPFTYAHDSKYKPFGVMLDSGEPEYPGCCIRFRAFGHTLILDLPQWVLNPKVSQVDTSHYPWSKPPHGYKSVIPREYGFHIAERAVHLHFGVMTHDSCTDKVKVYFIPWYCRRRKRCSWFDGEGNLFDEMQGYSYEPWNKARKNCPKDRFF